MSFFAAKASHILDDEREIGIGEFIGRNGFHVARRGADLLGDLLGRVSKDGWGFIGAAAVLAMTFTAVEGKQILAGSVAGCLRGRLNWSRRRATGGQYEGDLDQQREKFAKHVGLQLSISDQGHDPGLTVLRRHAIALAVGGARG